MLQLGNAEDKELIKGIEAKKNAKGAILLGHVLDQIRAMGFPIK